MQPPLLVSVLMPIHNAAATLAAAVESIRQQTFSDWELIAIDDGSTDNGRELLEQFARIDPRIKVHGWAENRGIVDALHLAMQHAQGSLIARMDADDLSHPERLAIQVAHLQSHPDTGLVSCLVSHLGDHENQQGYEAHIHWLNGLVTQEEISNARFIESPLAHPSVMFRRSVWDKWGGYAKGDFPEDYELWLRWLHQGVRMEKVPQDLFSWRDHPSRLSRTHDMYRPEAFYALRAKYLAALLKSSDDLSRRQVHVWGAGRLTRRRAEMLQEHDITIKGYIDVDPGKIGKVFAGARVLSPAEISPPGEIIILSYVANRGIRELIRADLERRGYAEMKDFILAS